MAAIHLILASASPRRRALVALLGYPFTVVVSGADEDEHLSAPPADYVRHTARAKAEAVAAALPPAPPAPRRILIAADTTVALEGAILGKPATPDEARAMLLALRGRDHDVFTAACVLSLDDGRRQEAVHHAVVTMRDYTPAEIDAYIATGDPLDKAGAYGIQHPFNPVARLSGCYLGVMGLSLCDLLPLLRALDVGDRIDPAALVDAHRGVLHTNVASAGEL